MADIQPTIDLIDGALRDYISPDAMRWVPGDDRTENGAVDTSGLQPTDDFDFGQQMVNWMLEFMPDRPLTDFQRLVLTGSVSALPPSGGEVGNLSGIPVIESPLVPEGHLLLVNPPRLQDFSFAPGPFSYSDDLHTWRMMACFTAPSHAHMVIFDEVSHRGSRWIRLPRRGAGWTAPRDNPRVRALHAAYRHRQLARRRRNR